MAQSIIDQIKSSVQKSGANKGKFIRVMDGKKVRIRFLQEFDKAFAVTMHDSFNRGISAICRTHFDEECPYCDDDDLKTWTKYCWSVWNYDANEVQVLMWQATSGSPVDQFLSLNDAYGTIMDRDYVVERKGSRFDTVYKVIPMDKARFRNEKAKPFTEKTLLKMLDKAFPITTIENDSDDDEDDDDEPAAKPAKKSTKDKGEKPSKTKPAADTEEDGTDMEWIQEKLESEDIDEDEFCKYHDIKSLKKLTKMSKKEIKAMVKDYNEFGFEEGDDDDDDDEDEDE